MIGFDTNSRIICNLLNFSCSLFYKVRHCVVVDFFLNLVLVVLCKRSASRSRDGKHREMVLERGT